MAKEILADNRSMEPLVLEDVQSWEDSRIDPEWIVQILNCRDTSGFTPTDEDVLRHLRGDVLTFCFKEDKVIGFNSIEFKSPSQIWDGLIPGLELSTTTGVYFAGAFVDGGVQKSGFYRQMTEQRIIEGLQRNINTVFTETQNPNIEAGILNTLEAMKSNGVISEYVMEKRILFPGLYGRCMYKEIPKNPKVSFDELNYSAGDAYGLVFHIR